MEMEDKNLIVVVGSIVLDYVSFSKKIPKRGETILGRLFTVNFGGKGANQCVAAAKLGGNLCMVGKIGDDYYANDYMNSFKSFNIDTTYVSEVKGHHTGIAQILVEESTGDNCIVVIPGANNVFNTNDLYKAKEMILKAKVLVLQFEIPLDVTLETLRLYKENKTGISIVNAAPAQKEFDEDIFKLPTIFCANETEASLITDIEIDTIDDAKKAGNVLLNRGCNIVLITLGDKGVIFNNQNEFKHVKTDKVKAVDTTGAGDSFIGSLAYLIANYSNLSLEIQITIACKLASVSVTQPGTQKSFPDEKILKNILEQLKLI